MVDYVNGKKTWNEINLRLKNNILQQLKIQIIVELKYTGKGLVQQETDEYPVNMDVLYSTLTEVMSISSAHQHTKKAQEYREVLTYSAEVILIGYIDGESDAFPTPSKTAPKNISDVEVTGGEQVANDQDISSEDLSEDEVTDEENNDEEIQEKLIQEEEVCEGDNMVLQTFLTKIIIVLFMHVFALKLAWRVTRVQLECDSN